MDYLGNLYLLFITAYSRDGEPVRLVYRRGVDRAVSAMGENQLISLELKQI